MNIGGGGLCQPRDLDVVQAQVIGGIGVKHPVNEDDFEPLYIVK